MGSEMVRKSQIRGMPRGDRVVDMSHKVRRDFGQSSRRMMRNLAVYVHQINIAKKMQNGKNMGTRFLYST